MVRDNISNILALFDGKSFAIIIGVPSGLDPIILLPLMLEEITIGL
jgi:hypothetical protein